MTGDFGPPFFYFLKIAPLTARAPLHTTPIAIAHTRSPIINGAIVIATVIASGIPNVIKKNHPITWDNFMILPPIQNIFL